MQEELIEQASAIFCEEYEPKRATAGQPIPRDEAQEQLKHAAGLCYALCCDLSNVEEQAKGGRNATPYNMEISADFAPLTTSEMKERLKEVAGICYGLAAEIKRDEEDMRFMREYINELRAELHERKQICPKQCFLNKRAATKRKGVKVAPLAPFDVAEERQRRKKQAARRKRY